MSIATLRPMHPFHAAPALMQVALFQAPRQVDVVDQPMPTPNAGEVRIHLEGCGVCASNIPVWEGREWFDYPRAPGSPGHEGWGIVDAVGNEVRGLRDGDRVGCLSYHAFAEYDIAEATSVVLLPAELEGKPFPAEPLGCAMNIFARSDIRAGQRVAIVGVGFLGALLVQLAVNAGAEVIAISRRESALELARRCGAVHTVMLGDAEAETSADAVAQQLQPSGAAARCQRVIEATGKQAGLDVASELVEVRGKLIVAGYHQDGQRQVNMQLWNWRGIDVINAHERDPAMYTRGMAAAVEAVADRRMDPFPLLTHRLPLGDLDAALRLAAERPEGFLKAYVTPRPCNEEDGQ